MPGMAPSTPSTPATIASDRGDYQASERLRRQALASFLTWYGPEEDGPVADA